MNIVGCISELKPEVVATYVVGIGAIAVGVWQFRRAFRLNKRAAVFDELSKSIQEAAAIVNMMSNETDVVIDHLAATANANSVPFDLTGRTQAAQDRLDQIKDTADKYVKYTESIFESYLKVLQLIKNIEKSTLVSSKSRYAARYLFYTATEQHDMVSAVSKVLQAFNTTPIPGEKPNIGPDAFNRFIELAKLISSRNQNIGNYLEDLEVILHNDLVRSLHGKARFGVVPVKHLSSKGLTDKRVKTSLL